MNGLLLYKYLITISTLALIVPINTTEVSAISLLVVTQKDRDSAGLIERAKQLYQHEQYIEAI